MRKYLLSMSGIAALVLLLSHGAIAQDKNEKDKEKDEQISKKKKDKEEKEVGKLSEYDELIIKKKNDKEGKVTIEVNKDGDVTVNGKPLDDYEDDNLSVRKHKIQRYGTAISPFRSQNDWRGGNSFGIISPNKAFLGVRSEKTEEGVKVTGVTAESAAEKAGLKEGDIITRIGDKKIGNPEDLFTAISKYKPEDKVSIAYKRGGKEQTTTATLGKRKGESLSFNGPQELLAPNIEAMPDMKDFNFEMPNGDGNFFYHGGRPRLGIKAQDTEDGKGVKVLSVDDESNAEKAGIKEDDVITEFDGTVVNSADELARAAEAARTKPTVKVKLLRDGKTQTIEIRIPKKLKTANL